MGATENDTPIVILGAGPAGMAAALGLIKAGHKVVVYERYPHARAAGTILNLWPPPVKALEDMGVDITDLGASCRTNFRSSSGKLRCTVRSGEGDNAFLGLLRPDLYTRMLNAIPEGVIQFNTKITDIKSFEDHVELTLGDGRTVHTPVLIGADGIDSMVRAHLWGSSPKRNHNLQIIGGYTLEPCPSAIPDSVEIHHSSYVQATYNSIVSRGRRGYQWWVLEAWDDAAPGPPDYKAHALKRAEGFPPAIKEVISATNSQDLLRWIIRDRVPIKQWSKGRVTLAGDAAHATSPYAAYGAGMSICDGYFLGQVLFGVDLGNTAAVTKALASYDAQRIPHTTEQVNAAHFLGQLFHHTPWPLTVFRDLFLDYSPFLQNTVGDKNPRDIMQQLEAMGDGIMYPAKRK